MILSPYIALMRLDRPIGILLLLWPALMALWLASHGQPDWELVVIFTLGTIVMRSAGCVINDMTDRKFDGSVKRTKQRPLVSGQLSVKQASQCLFILCLIALVLVSLTNLNTFLLSLGALGLTILYPFMKRVTHFPQVFLGAAFAFAIPMAYAAQSQPLTLDCWLLFAATVLWSVAYDTQYAMVDREDDLLIGVKSTAIFFNQFDRLAVLLSHLGMLGLMYYIGEQFGLNGFFSLSLVVALALMLYEQWLIRDRCPQACFKAFLHNQWIGLVLFFGVWLGF